MSGPLFASTELERPSAGETYEVIRRAVTFGPEPAPTGGENASARKERLRTLSWELFTSKVAGAIHARLGLLDGRPLDEVVTCPWSRLEPCTAACRCQGSGVVTIRLLVGHCRQMLVDIGVANRMPKKRAHRRKPNTRYHHV